MNSNPPKPTWQIRRVRSKFAKGLTDGGQRTANDPRRVYTSEDAALLAVCEELAALGGVYRIDPAPTAARKGGSVVVTADAVDAVYIITQRSRWT
jgi:hypothetical protein